MQNYYKNGKIAIKSKFLLENINTPNEKVHMIYKSYWTDCRRGKSPSRSGGWLFPADLQNKLLCSPPPMEISFPNILPTTAPLIYHNTITICSLAPLEKIRNILKKIAPQVNNFGLEDSVSTSGINCFVRPPPPSWERNLCVIIL